MRGSAEGPKLAEDVRAFRMNCVDDLQLLKDIILVSTGSRDVLGFSLTFFHPATCSSFQIPGTFLYPPASAEIMVASVISSVPGVEALWA